MHSDLARARCAARAQRLALDRVVEGGPLGREEDVATSRIIECSFGRFEERTGYFLYAL